MIYKITHIEKLECVIEGNSKEDALKKFKQQTQDDTETDILSIKELGLEK